MVRLTELALTLGTWGAAPPNTETLFAVKEQLTRWAKRNNVELAIEVYSEWERDRAALEQLLKLAAEGYPVQPVVRLEPRLDRLKTLATLGVREIVFEIPISPLTAGTRYLPMGAGRAGEAAAQGVRDAALLGIRSEVALVDIARARWQDVASLIEKCEREAVPRGKETRYRLVDSTGLASPLSGVRLPRSLPAWVRKMGRDLGIPPERIAVQAADRTGLALANVLGAILEGAGAATSLFGLGMGAGWAATEALLFHTETELELKELIELQHLFVSGRPGADEKPVSGVNSWESLSDTTPEALRVKNEVLFGFDPKKRLGIDPPPLLTPLSGHAGLLHLMHRHFPERHFESDDPRSLEISRQFEDEFATGRQQPVCWSELEPKIRAAGLLE